MTVLDATKMRGRLVGMLRSSGAPYLSLLLGSVIAAQFANYLWSDHPLVRGQSPSILIAFGLFAVSLGLWFAYTPEGEWPPSFLWFLGSLAVLWAVGVAFSILHEDLFNITAVLVLPVIAMVWLKRPGLRATFLAGDVFAWGLIAIAIGAQVLDWTGIHALHYEGWNRWPVLTEITGPIGRWEGPFGNVNYAGPIGAFLFIFGLFRHGLNRAAFVPAGVLIVLVSDSRASILASAVGVVVAIVILPSVGRLRIRRWMRIAGPLLLLAAFAVYVFGVDPTVNGRTGIWAYFLSVWDRSPLDGIGATGIQAAIEAGSLPGWANHGHSILIDPLVRYGVIGLLAVVGVVVLACLVAAQSAGRGFAAGAAILATFIAGGLTEDLVDWRYFGIQLIPLLLSVMLGATFLAGPRNEEP